jgi:DNA helicase-2/ATP-dependent DNA helicase PcrA
VNLSSSAPPPASPPAAKAQFRAGQRVRHKLFGEGMVLETRLTRNDEEVLVEFKQVGLKWLAVSLAKLEALK